jgi:hypothetical protein
LKQRPPALTSTDVRRSCWASGHRFMRRFRIQNVAKMTLWILPYETNIFQFEVNFGAC